MRNAPSVLSPLNTRKYVWSSAVAKDRIGDAAFGTGLRWTIGNALEVLFDDANFEALADLARDERYGKARQMIVLGLGKSRRPESVDVLLALVDDPDVDGHAVKALARLRAPKSRAALEGKLTDERAWVRSEARKGLAKLPS